MSEKNNEKSWCRRALLWARGKFFNTLVFMFLRKGLKQQLVGIVVLGGLIMSVGVGSYLVATCFFGWDYHNDLPSFYVYVSDLLAGFVNLGKLGFLLGVFLIGWLVNNSAQYCAKRQTERKDRFATAIELEIFTGASLTLACNAISSVFVVIFWVSLSLLMYSMYVDATVDVSRIKESMIACVIGYVVLNVMNSKTLCDDVQNLRKKYGIKPARVKVNNRRRTKKKAASGKNTPEINKQRVTKTN